MLSHSSALAFAADSTAGSWLTDTVPPIGTNDRFRHAREALVAEVRSRMSHRDEVAARPLPSTLDEETANSVTHGVGLVAAFAAGWQLIASVTSTGDVFQMIGCAVFATTMVMLYAASTLYHSVADEITKEKLRIGDHACIYLLIAGTYTPFLITFLRGPWGWSLLAVIWCLAAVGIAAKILGSCSHRLSTITYVGLGWIVLAAAKPVVTLLPSGALMWLVAGGVSYTVGVYFFVQDKKPYTHAIWHLFVMGGSACHYLAVAGYVAA
ncbi:MAG: hemolysin III family protein [Pirellulales bacterium]|nr:hemolysin III family protein [Pirellulales bacterium]